MRIGKLHLENRIFNCYQAAKAYIFLAFSELFYYFYMIANHKDDLVKYTEITRKVKLWN